MPSRKAESREYQEQQFRFKVEQLVNNNETEIGNAEFVDRILEWFEPVLSSKSREKLKK